MLLSKLTPAESLTLLNGEAAPMKDLLKTTFMDLAIKKVIEVFDTEKRSGRKIRIYKYVRQGANFSSYKALPHERIFLQPLQQGGVRILFRNMIKIGHQHAKSQNFYQKQIIQNPNLADCFKKNFYQRIFGGFSITSQGIEKKSRLESEIQQLQKEIPELIKNEHHKSVNILNTIHGNIILLGIQFELLLQIDQILLSEIYSVEKSSGGNGCGSGCTWDSHSSGCGGDSGCGSGCSGCSGCGGCSG